MGLEEVFVFDSKRELGSGSGFGLGYTLDSNRFQAWQADGSYVLLKIHEGDVREGDAREGDAREGDARLRVMPG